MTNQLYLHYFEKNDPLDVACKLEGEAIGLASSPKNFTTFRVTTDRKIETSDNAPLPVAEIYEFIICTKDWELSALRNGKTFDVCIKSEQKLTNYEPTATPAFSEKIPRNYLLWGDKKPPIENGWARLQSARIGTLVVPAPAGSANEKLAMTAIEYVQCDPHHGNAAVIAQRFTGLKWTTGEK